MLFGDIFAVFVLHQNGGQTGLALLAAARAVAAQDPSAVNAAFAANRKSAGGSRHQG
jgi:hypothetical protein